MYLVAIAWMYVVLMVAVAEASTGSLLGAAVTFVFYGLLPLAIVLYLMASPARRRARKAGEVAGTSDDPSLAPDGGDHAAGDAIAAERKEP